jgi:hypothetical protein
MFTIENSILLIVGIPALGVLLFWLVSHFRAEARARRHRGESHRPVGSQNHGPPLRAAAGKPRREPKR